MTVDIDTVALTAGTTKLFAINNAIDQGLLPEVAEAALEAVQAPNSFVAVRTGAMKDGLGYEVLDDTIQFTGREPYSGFVENRTQGILRTLEARDGQISRKAGQALQNKVRQLGI